MRKDHKLGLMSLTAIIVGTMIGAGVFALPQNLAAHASVGAVLIGWVIAGIGVVSLAMVFRNLSHSHPELDNGIYSYARAGFGQYIGFNSAWGYWISAALGNVSFAILLFEALSYFFPVFHQHPFYALIGESIFLWVFHYLVTKGIAEAAIVNLMITSIKLASILLFTVLIVFACHLPTLQFHFWGGHALGGMFSQVKSTMLVTLWVFIGVEGASIESSRARKAKDVGRSTLLGLGIVFILYVLISVLSFGVMPQSVLAHAHNPSLAAVIAHAVGPWGADCVTVAVMISLVGTWLGWTILCVQMPFDCALDKGMPKALAKQNKHGAPINALWLNNGFIQAVLIVSYFYQQGYLALLKLSTSCILVPYFLCALFAWKSGMKGRVFAIIATIYGLWLVYAAGLHNLLLGTILYAVGILFFMRARHQHGEKIFTKLELLLALIITLLAVWAIIYFVR